ncbi:MAG: response regulator [Chloroflexi bacterium]|nr:response regulator [Chloroflexota bacterium]
MIELTERIAFHLNKLKFATTKTTPSEIKTASEAPRKRLATTTLIIDPDEKSRSIIKSVLTRLNQSVVEASNATEAITAFKHHSPDIIISEWSLPDNDGFSMLSELKRVRRGKELLTVMMSARLSPEAQRKAHFLGITNFLVKPLNPAKVEMMIADSVRQTIRNKKRNAGKAA